MNFVNTAGTKGALTLDQDETVLGGSVFGQLTAGFENGLSAMAGLRYDITRFKAQDNLINATNPDDSGSRSMPAVSPSLGLSFAVIPQATFYANVATSFETPTTTEMANRPSGAGGFNPDLEPQRALSFEAGAKGLISGIASYQISAFRANIENSLIPFEVPGAPGRSFFRNAGSAVHQGVEAGVTVSPISGVRANLAYTYLDAYFDEYTVGTNDLSGKSIPGVSPNRFDGSLNVELPFGAFASVNGRYADQIWVNDLNLTTSPAYTVLDVRAGLTNVRLGNLAIEPFAGVTNLLDEEYNSSITVNAFGNPGRFFEPGPPRSFYFGGQIRFEAD
jgi:iron complex outermembrane receptor protein